MTGLEAQVVRLRYRRDELVAAQAAANRRERLIELCRIWVVDDYGHSFEQMCRVGLGQTTRSAAESCDEPFKSVGLL